MSKKQRSQDDVDDGDDVSIYPSGIFDTIRKNQGFILFASVMSAVLVIFVLIEVVQLYGFSAYGTIQKIDASGYWVLMDHVAQDMPINKSQIGLLENNPVLVMPGICADTLKASGCVIGAKVMVSESSDRLGREAWQISALVMGWNDVEAENSTENDL